MVDMISALLPVSTPAAAFTPWEIFREYPA